MQEGVTEGEYNFKKHKDRPTAGMVFDPYAILLTFGVYIRGL